MSEIGQMATSTRFRDITAEDFSRDSHAAKYRGELTRHPAAFTRLFALLNDPTNEQRLVDAEMHVLPALSGIVRFIEADPTIEPVLTSGPSSSRFRQTIGVAVKLKMAKLGWRATRRNGTVKAARYFTKAMHYVADPAATPTYTASALSALDAVAHIGDDEEREQTGRELVHALAGTRDCEGRPF